MDSAAKTTAQGNGLAWLDALRTEDGVFAVDARQRFIHWGPSAQALLGYSSQEVLGRPCYEVMAGVDAANFHFCRRNCPITVNALRGRPTPNYDVRTCTKEGAPKWVNVSILVPQGTDRKAGYVVHMFRDVTERRRMEMVAQRALADLKELMAEAPPAAEVGVSPTPLPALTRRELQVLRLLACGVDTRRIAATLSVSPLTARNHITNLVAKLGVDNRLQAVVYASQRRLI